MFDLLNSFPEHLDINGKRYKIVLEEIEGISPESYKKELQGMKDNMNTEFINKALKYDNLDIMRFNTYLNKDCLYGEEIEFMDNTLALIKDNIRDVVTQYIDELTDKYLN